jgi:hypothetical protein
MRHQKLMCYRISAAVLLICTITCTARAQERSSEPPTEGTPLFQEPAAMTAGFNFAEKYFKGDTSEKNAGWFPVFKTSVTGDGWISLGGGYRAPVLQRRAWFETSAAYSWRGYKVADAEFEVPEIGGSRVSLGTQVHWQDLTQVRYFGAGPDSSSALRTDYGLRTTEIIGFATYRPREVVALEARVGRVSRPDLSSSSGPFDRGYPDTMLIFHNEPGFDQIEQPGFLHTQVSATADTRDHRGLPRRGGMYRAAAAVYSDRDDGRFSFRRYEVEALHAIPLSPVRWTLALHGWSVFSDTTGDSEVPAYMLPSLGGSTTLRSYADYRFHDRHLLLVSAESRWALFEHVDAALFADAGSVAAQVRDLGLKEISYGVGLRVHIRSTTIGRVDVAHGREGLRLLFRLSDPFRLNRLSRRNAAIPFVP